MFSYWLFIPKSFKAGVAEIATTIESMFYKNETLTWLKSGSIDNLATVFLRYFDF